MLRLAIFVGTGLLVGCPSTRPAAPRAADDGSAASLEALLRDRGKVHGMTETAKLSDAQIADLVAFLESS